MPITATAKGHHTKTSRSATSFQVELTAYRKLSSCSSVPKLIGSDAATRTLVLERRGTSLFRLPTGARPKAVEVIWALGAVHAYGMAHGDFHAQNVLVDADGSITLIDFEWSSTETRPLAECRDLTGDGPHNPRTDDIHWDGKRRGKERLPHDGSIRTFLGTDAGQAYASYLDRLRAEVRRASGFKTGSTFDKDGRIYQSFSHPRFVWKHAQRNTEARLSRFKLAASLKNTSVLDLGSNLGAVTLACASRGARVLGVEADDARVDVARRIAGVCGLQHQVAFKTQKIENTLKSGESFDIILALAVDAWVPDPASMYAMIAERARRLVIMESNVGSPRQDALKRAFTTKGWKVEPLGDTSREDAFGNRRYIYRMSR